MSTSVGDPGENALTDQLPFKLGHRRNHVEQQASLRRAQVQVVAQRDETDAVSGQVLDGGDQVLERAPETVELPHHNGVEAPAVCVGHHAVELGPRVFRAGDAVVDILADDLERAPLGVLAQLVELNFRVLIAVGRDPGIERNRADFLSGCCSRFTICGSQFCLLVRRLVSAVADVSPSPRRDFFYLEYTPLV